MSIEPEDRMFHPSRPGTRLDRAVADALGCGRRRARRWIEEGRVRVAGRRAVAAMLLGPEDSVWVRLDPPSPAPSCAQLGLLWEDDRYLAVNKPAGMHSLRGIHAGSVAEFLARERPQLDRAADRPGEAGLVHRLDRDTSGVLVAAKTESARSDARRALAAGAVDKHYLALVEGRLSDARTLEIPLVRLRSSVRPGRPGERAYAARTRVMPLECGGAWTLVALRMSTGVTHQLRAHLAASGHPILGDPKYGGGTPAAATRAGQLLHAWRIHLEGRFDVSAPAPPDFLTALARLRREG